MSGLSAVHVVQWDVTDGDILGALIKCPECPCDPNPRAASGCSGDGVLFRPYRLPGNAFIDLHRDADLLIRILDREATKESPG